MYFTNYYFFFTKCYIRVTSYIYNFVLFFTFTYGNVNENIGARGGGGDNLTFKNLYHIYYLNNG